LLQHFSPFLLEKELSRKLMAVKYSFHLWNDLSLKDGSDSNLRYDFLVKFAHNVERKNFQSLEKLRPKLKEIGNYIYVGSYDESYYAKALEAYLFSQKRHLDVFELKKGVVNGIKKKFWKITTKQYD
jgi:hypothetical protein